MRRHASTRQSRQLQALLLKQKLFKEAALEAKKNGDKAQALVYLKNARGFQPLIEASQSGLPVDMTSVSF